MLRLSYRFFVFLLFTQILCQTSWAQQVSLFTKYTPAVYDSVQFNPDAFAIGDVNGDGYEDLILKESGKLPIVFYFSLHSTSNSNPEGIGEWNFDLDTLSTVEGDFRIPRDTIPVSINSLGPIQILDGKNSGNNEIYLHYNVYDRPAVSFKFDPVDGDVNSKIKQSTNPAGFALTRNGSLTWTYSDFNYDGLLDAIQGLQVNKTAQNFLFYNVFNQNNSSYQRNTTSDVVLNYGRTVGLYSFDFNNDGYTDVWEINANYSGITALQDFLYVGDGTDLKWNSTSILNSQTASLGAAIGDYDNDGDLDIYQLIGGSLSANYLYQNNGNFDFQRVQNNLTRDLLDSRSAMWGDFNNDGFLDLVIAEYNGTGNTGAYPNLFINNGPNEDGTYTFTKRIFSSFSELNSQGNWNNVSFVDVDLDGDLDIFLTGKHKLEPVQLFRNKLIQTNEILESQKQWVGFDLISTNSFTKTAFNAKLTVKATINGVQQTLYKELQLFHGFLAQQSKLIHFGLGDATSFQLEIIWPSGYKQNLSFAKNTLNKYHTLTEPVASRLSISSVQPYSLTANLEESRIDTLLFQNIGQATLTISSVSAKASYFKIKSFTKNIAPNTQGLIVLETLSLNSADIGIKNDTLLIQSNNLSGTSRFVIQTEIVSRPARFSKITDEINAPFLNEFGSWQYLYAGQFNQHIDTDLLLLPLQSNSELYYQADSVFSKNDSDLMNTMGLQSKHSTIGDVNHDGLHDVLFVNEGASNVLLVSEGNSYVKKTISAFATPKISRYAQMHDIDGNGYLDLIIANNSSQKNQIILNYSGTTFLEVSKSDDDFTGVSGFSNFIRIVDLNSDGLDDILVAETDNPFGNKIIYYQQTEPLVFKKNTLSGITTINFTANGIHVFDKDNDSDPDILLISSINTVASILFENNGNGFQKVNEDVFEAIKGTPGDVLITDFNMDGYLDIYFSETDFTASNKLLQSAGGSDYVIIKSGELVQSENKASYGATIFDFNKDAKPDFLIANYFGEIELYQNDLTEYNRVAIIPYSVYKNGKQSVRPGTKVEIRAFFEGKNQRISQTIGTQSLYSETLQAVWFGLGDAETAEYKITIPGLEKVFTGNLSIINDYEIIELTEVSVDELNPIELPKNFVVSDVFPNPFNPTTSFNLELPQSGAVFIEVFNSIGKRISSTKLELAAGYYTHNVQLSQNSSGIYFVRVTFKNEIFTKKMLLIK